MYSCAIQQIDITVIKKTQLINDSIPTRFKRGFPWNSLCGIDTCHPNKSNKTSDSIKLLNIKIPSETPAEAIFRISQSSTGFFTTFNAQKGYHQCELDEESQSLTTFLTPFGRYKYLRAPYGISSISDHYNRRMHECFVNMKDFARVVDDVIVYDNNINEHYTHVEKFLQVCQQKGVSLNKDKFVFGQKTAKFAGHILSKNGYSLDPDLCRAIAQFPKPTNISDLRSFFGLANQLSSFSKNVAEALQPLRSLLSTNNAFMWTENHNIAFTEARNILSSESMLAYYDPQKPTILATDASRLNGLGLLLTQEQQDGTMRAVQAGSRFLTDTESRYAVIELEALAVAWALKKCRQFLLGRDNFTVVVDHKPLLPIFSNRRLDEIDNPRLQRIRMKTIEFNFTMRWCKGQDNYSADALSRSPIDSPVTGDELGESETEEDLHSFYTVG